jgi:alpha-galactosidase
MLRIEHAGLHLAIAVDGDLPARLLHLGSRPFDDTLIAEDKQWAYRLVEIRAAGEDHDYIDAGRYAGSGLGARLRPVEHLEREEAGDRVLTVVQRDTTSGLRVASHLRFPAGLPVVESRTEILNTGEDDVTLLSVSSFFLCGATKGGSTERGLRTEIATPHNGWYAEFQWRTATACDLGLNNSFDFGSRHHTVHSVGTWCSANHLPMGWLRNADTGEGLLWEIDHEGSWSWQVGEAAGEHYLHVAGPTEAESQWWLTLRPGERFESVPVAIAPAPAFDDAVGALTRWRRSRRTAPLGGQPVVFNDYMNCLMGDPTEAKVLPLIEAAAALGAEVYCVDAGWYLPPGLRWSSILGWWEVDRERFPSGLRPVMDRIRECGMIPGLWFEIEVMTALRPGFSELPDAWFFHHHGRRWTSHRRSLLDFRNPEVRAFADRAIDMAVLELGCGFLKLDYNTGSNAGPDGGESPGSALMEAQAAFLGWLDGVRGRHPDLLLEHCASGGQRICQPFLSRMGVTSNSDQGDPFHIARLAAASVSAIPPEQDGTWALPKVTDTPEEIAFAMLCALPLRMNLAGDAAAVGPEGRALILEAVKLHKRLRAELGEAVPLWPWGLPAYHDDWICLGLKSARTLFLAVWRRGGSASRTAPLPSGVANGRVLYPGAALGNFQVHADGVTLTLPKRAGRLLAFDLV